MFLPLPLLQLFQNLCGCVRLSKQLLESLNSSFVLLLASSATRIRCEPRFKASVGSASRRSITTEVCHRAADNDPSHAFFFEQAFQPCIDESVIAVLRYHRSG